MRCTSIQQHLLQQDNPHTEQATSPLYQEIRAHLETCEHCQQYAAFVQGLHRLGEAQELIRQQDPRLSEAWQTRMDQQLMEQLHDTTQQAGNSATQHLGWWGAIAFGMAAALLLLLPWTQPTQPTQPPTVPRLSASLASYSSTWSGDSALSAWKDTTTHSDTATSDEDVDTWLASQLPEPSTNKALRAVSSAVQSLDLPTRVSTPKNHLDRELQSTLRGWFPTLQIPSSPSLQGTGTEQALAAYDMLTLSSLQDTTWDETPPWRWLHDEIDALTMDS